MNGPAPAVSVIMTSFDRMAYLPTAVESVFAQTFGDWELIIADDGSGAVTRDYLRTLRETARVRVLLLPHSGNPGTARNAALRVARGEWIAFLDSDDAWHADKLDVQLAAMRLNPQRRWSYSAVRRINAAGGEIPRLRQRPRQLHEGNILEPLIRWRAGIALPTVIAHRELLDQAGGFDESCRMFEDFDLWLRLASQHEASAVATPLASVRHHDDHYSSQGERAMHDWIALFERWQPRFELPRLKHALEAQCVRCTTRIAWQQAVAGQRIAAIATLLRGRSGAWRYREWWGGALSVLARTFLPPRLLNIRRTTGPRAA